MRCSDLPSRHFDHPGLNFLQPSADGLQGAGGERGKFLHQPRPRGGRPGQHHAVIDGRCGRRIALEPDRHGDTEGLSGDHVTHHDLLPGWRGLAGAHMAVQQQEEGMRVVALREDRAVLRIARGVGLAENFGELLTAEPRE